MLDRLRDPEGRVRAAWVLFCFVLVGWAVSHVLLVVLHPAGASSWVFHLLLALSWMALALSALTIVVTTDVRREQDNGE